MRSPTTPRIQPLLGHAFTLAELVVVILIIAATAGIAALALSSTKESAHEDAARVSFQRIKAAIYGKNGKPGYYQDLGYPPRRLVDLLQHDQAQDDPYDPVTRKGWNGPYLVSNGSIPTETTDPRFIDLEQKGYVEATPTGARYCLPGEPTLNDPLGYPYVLYPPYDPTSPVEPTHVMWRGRAAKLEDVIETGGPDGPKPKAEVSLELTQQ